MLEQKDLCAIAELIDSRIGKTEDMIKETNKRVSEYRNTQSGSTHLIKEMNRITGFYQQEMEKLGIKTTAEGTLEINSEQLQESVSSMENEDTQSSLKALKSFSQSMIRKSGQISLNPVSYMNKTIVAYKNPGNNFLSPYVTSAYSGMFFNNYC